MAIRQDGGWLCSSLGGSAVLVEDVLRELAVDKLQLAPGGALQGKGADAVNIAEAPLRGLVDEAESIRGEDGLVGPGLAQAVLDVLGRVFGLGVPQAEADMDA